MFTQLSRLSIEADGRYATEQELQFLKDYFETVETRISTYEKIRDGLEDIFKNIEAEKQARNAKYNEKLFFMGSEDRSGTCLRDMRGILRRGAANMLINDLDWMREAVLLWYYTIVRSFNYERDTQIMYQLLEQVVNQYLTSEEIKVAKPMFQLNQTILG